MMKWRDFALPSEMVAFITDNYKIIGHVQKIDVDDAVKQGSGAETCQFF